MNGPMFRRIMVLAHKHGLTNGDYIFLVVNYYNQRRLFGIYDWKQVKLAQYSLSDLSTVVPASNKTLK